MSEDGTSAKLDLEQFTLEALKKFGFEDAVPVSVPMQPGTHLVKAEEGAKASMNPSEYKSHIGILMYLTRVRPDIAYPVMQLSRFCECPIEQHVTVLRHVWRYLAGTKSKGIVFKRDKIGMQPVYYVDSDWNNNQDNGRSVTGFVGRVCGAPFIVRSKMQTVAAQSTCEAEYMSLAAAGNDVIWVTQFVGELGYPVKIVNVFIDNQSAKSMGEKPALNQRNKHIRIRFHVVRDYIKNKEMRLEYVESKDNVADLLTKALGRVAFSKHRDFLVQ